MRTRVWCTSLGLAALAVACGDQPLEVVPERVAEPHMTRGPGILALATASTEDGLSITTDKDDYQPGDTVWFTGAGWPANDVLDIVLTDEPLTHPPHEWTVDVGEGGTFVDSTYVVDEGDLDVTFTLVATSRATGRSLSVTFTDGNLNALALNPASRSAAQTGSVQYSIDVTMTGNGNACTVTLSVLASPALPTGAVPSIPNNVVAATNANFSRTLTITTTGVTAGSYPFTVQAARGANCQGNGNLTVNGTLIVFGPAAKVVFGQQPTSEVSATPVTPAVTVQVQDAGGRVVATSSAPVMMAIGTNPGGGTLSGTLTQNAVDGIATFPDLSIDKIGTGYTLAASSGSLTGATSSAFNITLGPAAKLAFFTQPSGGTPGTAFPTQPAVEVQDAGGNRRTSNPGGNASITLAIVPGSGAVGAALTCTTNPLGASSGLATFAGCRINLAGTGYRLRATSGSLTSADSDPFDVVANNQAPTVDAGAYTVAEGTELTLAPIVNDPDAGDVLTYHWTVNPTGIDAGGTCAFDDDTKKNAKITCTDDSQGAPGGKFTLTLEVNDGSGHTVADNADLTVSNAAPVASAGGAYSGNEGQAIQLNGSANDPGDNDDPHLTYLWAVTATGIDAGGACAFDDATKKNAKVTCTDDSNAGTFTLSLVATDDDGAASAASQTTLDVDNLAPVANAGPGYTGDEGSAIQLAGSANDPGDNDDPHLTYQWTAVTTGIDPGGTCTFDDATDKNAKVTCTDDGAFKVRLVATDDDGGVSAFSEASLAVNNAGPVANAGGDYTGLEGSPVQLNGTVTDAGANDTHTWFWKYVAGPGVDAGASCSFSNATDEDPTITCTDDGTVELTLTVTDDDDDEGSDTALLTLANVNPTADAGGPYSGAEGSAIPLTGVENDAGANDVLTRQWSYTAGAGVDAGASCSFSPSNLALSPTITCTDDGTFNLTLTVSDDDGGSGTDNTTLTLSNVNPVAGAGGPYTGAEGSATALTGTESDAGANDVLTQQWSYTPGAGVDAGASCAFSPNSQALSPMVTCTDDGTYQLTLTVYDDDGGSGASSTTLTVANVNPVITSLTKPDGSALPATLIVAGSLGLRATFGDAGSNDTHAAELDCGTGYADLGAVTSPLTASCTFATVGPKTIRVKVKDDDGGYDVATHEIVVKYNFDGFYAPVDRPNTMNVSKAGQAIPLKWRLTDANGAPVSNVVAVTIRAKDQACSAGATTDQLEEYAAGASGLQNQGDGRYQFNWKTPTTYSGSCKSIELVFGTGGLSYVDGPYAYFSFKK